jgi:hypothetical protein
MTAGGPVPRTSTSPIISTTTVSSSTSSTATLSSSTPTSSTSTPAIPPGAIALFATKSGGSESDFLRLSGGNVYWDSNQYKLLRYVPEAGLLDEFGWTSSKSYSRSYIYGITAGDWVYSVKCFLDSGRKDIARLDPKTGKTVASFGAITTADMYDGFTICGDRVIYRTKVSKDLLGRRTGGGNVMVMEIGAFSPVEVLDYYDDDNMGAYYGIGNDLVSVVTTWEDDTRYYDIYRVNPQTLALGELLDSFSSGEITYFFEGDTALYWTEEDPSNGNIYVARLPVTGNPVYFLEISETTPKNLSIDESQGKVLLAFEDDTPESPFYYLSDLSSDETIELDIDPGIFSKSKLGNGQFVILK